MSKHEFAGWSFVTPAPEGSTAVIRKDGTTHRVAIVGWGHEEPWTLVNKPGVYGLPLTPQPGTGELVPAVAIYDVVAFVIGGVTIPGPAA